AARPDGAELARERLRGRVAGAREGMKLGALIAHDLRDDVGRRTEAVDSDAASVACLRQRAVADEPRAEQRRRRDGFVNVGNRKAEVLVRNRELGEAAR